MRITSRTCAPSAWMRAKCEKVLAHFRVERADNACAARISGAKRNTKETYRSGHNEPHSKCGYPLLGTWVRIPPSPFYSMREDIDTDVQAEIKQSTERVLTEVR